MSSRPVLSPKHSSEWPYLVRRSRKQPDRISDGWLQHTALPERPGRLSKLLTKSTGSLQGDTEGKFSADDALEGAEVT